VLFRNFGKFYQTIRSKSYRQVFLFLLHKKYKNTILCFSVTAATGLKFIKCRWEPRCAVENG
jgi:hypothetical protein